MCIHAGDQFLKVVPIVVLSEGEDMMVFRPLLGAVTKRNQGGLRVLTCGFFLGLVRFATVFIRLLRIAGFLPRHVAGIEMVLTIGILAR
jgi:hypothetical protein